MDRFGMTPATRERVAAVSSAAKIEEMDEVERFLFRKGPLPRSMAVKSGQPMPVSIPGELDQ
jgi:hypothetical protein